MGHHTEVRRFKPRVSFSRVSRVDKRGTQGSQYWAIFSTFNSNTPR